MDIRFDANAAEELIRQMDAYCKDIVKETRMLLEVVKNDESWNDTQQKAFQNNITELAKDLNAALTLESEYMRAFHQRVMELKG